MKTVIDKGTTFVLTHSTYGGEDAEGVIAVLKAVCTFDIKHAERTYLNAYGYKDTMWFNTSEFVQWLQTANLADLLIQFPEWNIKETTVAGEASTLQYHGNVPR